MDKSKFNPLALNSIRELSPFCEGQDSVSLKGNSQGKEEQITISFLSQSPLIKFKIGAKSYNDYKLIKEQQLLKPTRLNESDEDKTATKSGGFQLVHPVRGKDFLRIEF